MSPATEFARLIVENLCCQKHGCACIASSRKGHGLTHCFIHNDVGPSLSVDVKHDTLLVNCQAGCAQKDIVDALRNEEMWPPVEEPTRSTAAEIVAEYDYRDEHGELIFQALRYFPKAFKQRRPDGKGGWIWRLDGIKHVPYRLPEILADTARVVLVPEGEKDVDRLRAGGLVATCNAGGAGKWTAEHARYLKDRHVVVVPDNDDAGRAHGLKVARSLAGLATSIKWVELPGLAVKGDVSDWLDAGHTIDELKDLVRRAGPPPNEADRHSILEKVGLNYRFVPQRAPIVATFSRITDKRDDVSAEIRISHVRDGRTLITPRRVNLLGANGVSTGIINGLEHAELGVDKGLWQEILGEGFEQVLHARRNGLEPKRIGGDIKKPGPIAWFCDGLVLKNVFNVWLAAAGTGKSTAAKALAVCAAAGRDFLGRFTQQARVLYLDWEDDQEEFERVVVEVCEAMHIWPVPEIVWVSMRGKRLRDNLERLIQIMEEEAIDLTIFDAIAAAGGDPGEHRGYEGVALELEECLGQLPRHTLLGLDHITSEEHRNRQASVPTKARGAERKVEFTRNQWTMMLDHELRESGRHVVTWHHTKINASAYRPQFTIEFVHDQGRLEIAELSVTESPEAVARLSLKRQGELFVLDHPGSTAEQVCLAVRDKTTPNLIESTRALLKQSVTRGVLQKDAAGAYWPPSHPDMPTQADLPDGMAPPPNMFGGQTAKQTTAKQENEVFGDLESDGGVTE